MLRKLLSSACLGGIFVIVLVSASSAATKTIAKPMFNGNRLDWCVNWSEDCGKPAADAYCRSQGFAKATLFQPERHIGWRSPTRLIGTGATCDLGHCDGFRYITCLKRPVVAATKTPQSDRYGLAKLGQRPLPRMASSGPLTIIPPIPSPKPALTPARKRQAALREAKVRDGLTAAETLTAKPTQAKLIEAPSPDAAKSEVAMADPSGADVSKAEPVATAMPAGFVGAAAAKVFEKPMYNGKRLAWCEQFDSACGQPAADAFCKTQGFSRAADFAQDAHIGDVAPTRSIGSGAVCDQVPCDGFKLIACAM